MNPVPQLPRGPQDKAKLYLTADEHYGHDNILEYQERPFPSIKLMNRDLITNHNAIVRPEDHTIHIGDFSLGDSNGKSNELIAVVRQLNGFHYFMDGSHDRSLATTIKAGWPADLEPRVAVLPKLFEFVYGGTKITLCHYAMAKWWCSHHGSVHFFGHSHGHYTHPGRALDVGVDVQGFAPVLIDRAISTAMKKPILDNHPQ